MTLGVGCPELFLCLGIAFVLCSLFVAWRLDVIATRLSRQAAAMHRDSENLELKGRVLRCCHCEKLMVFRVDGMVDKVRPPSGGTGAI